MEKEEIEEIKRKFPKGRNGSVAIRKLISALEAAQEEAAGLRKTLEFYANPDTYFAIGLFPDAPCGSFVDDLEEIEGMARPGKRARQALARTEKEGGG